jgi:hypothetical protein
LEPSPQQNKEFVGVLRDVLLEVVPQDQDDLRSDVLELRLYVGDLP